MNQHIPIISPSSPLGRPQPERRSHVRIVVFVVLAIHLVVLVGLQIQGCKHLALRDDTTSATPANALPLPATNLPAAATPVLETNPPPPLTLPSPPIVVQPLAPPPGTKTYSVVKGDSFYKITRANGTSMSALANANPGVDPAKLKVGQVLQLPQPTRPASTFVAAAATPVTRTATANHSPNSYVVKSGDTLAKIAGVHGTTIKALRTANGLKADTIVVGQKLKLPETGAATASDPRNSTSHP